LTSRNFKETDFQTVVEMLDRAVKIASDVKTKCGKFVLVLMTNVNLKIEIFCRS
jgi:hypothetical protein